MAKVIKYSKIKLLEYLKLFNSDVYLYFYDLEISKFGEVTNKFNKLISNISNYELKNEKYKTLLIGGKLINNQVSDIVDELDNLDIGEFEIMEVKDNSAMLINNLNEKEFLSLIKEKVLKSIYLNKDEKIIQIYNFSD